MNLNEVYLQTGCSPDGEFSEGKKGRIKQIRNLKINEQNFGIKYPLISYKVNDVWVKRIPGLPTEDSL